MGKLDDRRTGSSTSSATSTTSASSAGGSSRLERRRQLAAQTEQAEEIGKINAAQRDIDLVVEGKPEQVKDWKNIASLATRLSTVEDPQAKETLNALLWTYGEQIKPHTEAIGGKYWWDQNYTEQPEVDRPWYAGIVEGAAPVFDYLDQWGTSARSAIAGVESALTDDGLSAGDGIRHAVRQGTRAIDPTRALPGFDGISGGLENVEDPTIIKSGDGQRAKLLDNDGDGQLNFREALGKEADSGGKGLAIIDFIGSIVTDPTTYVTFGGSAMAKTGMRAAEEAAQEMAESGIKGMSRELAEEMNQTIARQGFKALNEEQQQLYKSLLRHANDLAAEKGGRTTTRLGRDLVETQLEAVGRGGQSGMRLAGSTVIAPSKLGDLGRATGLLGDVAYGRKILDEGGETLTTVIRESVQQGLVGRLRDIPAVDKALSSLDLYGAVRARFGGAVADGLRESLSITRSQENEVKEVMVRMGADMHKNGLLKNAIEEVGDQETLERAMNEFMSSGGNLDEVVSVGGEATKQLFETMVDVRTEIYQATLRGMGYSREDVGRIIAGDLAPPSNLRDINTYVPRILTDAVRNDSKLLAEIRNLSDDAAKDIEGGGVSDGFLKRRGIARSMDDLFESNDEAKRIFDHLDIDAPEQLFETNVPAALVARSESAFRAAADVDLLDNLADLTGPGGIPLGFRAVGDASLTAEAMAEKMIKDAGGRLADYRKVTLPNGTVYRVHEELAAPLEDVRRIFGDPKEISAFGKFFDKMNNLWAVTATVGAVNPGFHARNSLGNMFNAFLGGTRDPSVFGKAAALQDKHRDIMKAVRESGETFETAARNLDIDPKDLDVLLQARKLGVLGDGRSLDVLRETAGEGQVAKAGSRFNPMSEKSLLTSMGRTVGGGVEGNARLGVFIDQLNKGASPQAAAAHTKRYLFDYGDLTRFESETLRRGARFYTFTRKNAALQAYALTRYPGRVANAEETVNQLIELATGTPEHGEQDVPPWMKGAQVRSLGGADAAVDYDTPFSSFMETVGLVSPLIPDNSPEAAFRERESFISRFESLFSGVGASTIDYLEEQRTGRDSFTGRVLTPPGTMKDGEDVGKLRDHWLFRAVDTAAPVTSRLERQGRKLGVGANGEDQEPTALALANILAGLQTYELDDDTDDTSRYVTESVLADALEDLRNRGIDVPSLDEARAAGELALKDRVVEALLYSWEETEDGELVWSEAAKDDRLLNILPKDVRVALGLPEPSTAQGTSRGARPEYAEGSEGAAAVQAFDDAQIIGAISQYLGRELSDDELARMLVALPGAPSNSMLEDEGLEPIRTSNRFDPKAVEDEEAARSEAIAAFEQRAANVGMDLDYLRELRPRLSDFERLLQEAESANVAHDDLLTYIMYAKDEGGGGILSRNDKAFLNVLYGGEAMDGAFDITSTRIPEFTEEDADKAREKAWQVESEMRLVADLWDLPQPTDQQVRDYILNVQMSGAELDLLDEVNLPNAKNRKDVRSYQQKYEDASREREASTSGLRFEN